MVEYYKLTKNSDSMLVFLIRVIQPLIEMKLKQRKKDGDTEGFEAGSEHWLKLNIWKVEQDWRKQKDNEAKKESTLETADFFN